MIGLNFKVFCMYHKKSLKFYIIYLIKRLYSNIIIHWIKMTTKEEIQVQETSSEVVDKKQEIKKQEEEEEDNTYELEEEDFKLFEVCFDKYLKINEQLL